MGAAHRAAVPPPTSMPASATNTGIVPSLSSPGPMAAPRRRGGNAYPPHACRPARGEPVELDAGGGMLREERPLLFREQAANRFAADGRITDLGRARLALQRRGADEAAGDHVDFHAKTP